MTDDRPEPFRYDAEVASGEKRQFRYEVGEAYLGDPVAVPVTVVNGHHDGPRIVQTNEEIGSEIVRGEFDGYRAFGLRWTSDGEEAE